MPADRIEADYLIETAFDPAAAAEAMAGEQSSGTFVAVPGETKALRERAAARVEMLEVLGEAASAALPGARHPAGRPILRARVTISWPAANVNGSLPMLMATVAGNLFELGQFSGLRLLDIRPTPDFLDRNPGPRFGVAGTRRLAGVAAGPLIGTIVKPSIGLDPGETADLVRVLCEGGIDFIKDDELQGDARHCPFDARVDAVMRVIRAHAERTGRMVMYAFNLTGEIDEMRRRHDIVRAAGGSCVMASLNSVGLSGLSALARHAELPIHAHRNGWGYLSRHPALGWEFTAWQKLWRLAGADHMHVNGIGNKFSEDDASVIRSARACGAPLFPGHPCAAMPVFSSGQTVRQAWPTFAALGHADLIFAAGGGILAHPGGPAAGVASLRAAWEAAMAGIAPEVAARGSRPLAEALEAFR